MVTLSVITLSILSFQVYSSVKLSVSTICSHHHCSQRMLITLDRSPWPPSSNAHNFLPLPWLLITYLRSPRACLFYIIHTNENRHCLKIGIVALFLEYFTKHRFFNLSDIGSLNSTFMAKSCSTVCITTFYTD